MIPENLGDETAFPLPYESASMANGYGLSKIEYIVTRVLQGLLSNSVYLKALCMRQENEAPSNASFVDKKACKDAIRIAMELCKQLEDVTGFNL